jgi:hypothetical protein
VQVAHPLSPRTIRQLAVNKLTLRQAAKKKNASKIKSPVFMDCLPQEWMLKPLLLLLQDLN